MKVTQPAIMNKKVITRWRADLLSEDTHRPRFNMDYPILEHEGSDPSRFEGDPGFILAYTYADVKDDSELSGWMADKQTEALIHHWTGIPVEDAKKLVEPKRLWEVNYPTRTITAKQFVMVLDKYLESGHVLWELVLADNPNFKIAKEDLPA